MTTPPAARRRKTLLWAAVVLGALLALAAAWEWTPLREFAEPRVVAGWLRAVARTGWLPLLIAAIYIGSNMVMFPNTVLCLATILALGPVPGFLYATGGSLLAALVAFGLARRHAPKQARTLNPGVVERIGAALKHGGVVQITLLRLLPLAPFNVINVMAGVARVRWLPFALGTLFGLLPGNLLFALFGRQLRQILANPEPVDVALLAAVAVVGSAAVWWLHRLTAPARA